MIMTDKKREYYLHCLIASVIPALNGEKLAAQLTEGEQRAAKAITEAIKSAIIISESEQ